MKKVIVLLVLILLARLFMDAYYFDKSHKTIESYCSVINAHNVADYKACRNLSALDILSTLENKYNNTSAVPTLEVLK